MRELALGLLFSGALTTFAAWSIYQPAPPVEKVVEVRYRCPDYYETFIPIEYEFFVGVRP